MFSVLGCQWKFPASQSSPVSSEGATFRLVTGSLFRVRIPFLVKPDGEQEFRVFSKQVTVESVSMSTTKSKGVYLEMNTFSLSF